MNTRIATENTNLKTDSQTRLLVFAGPNGSGKSTVSKGHDIYGIYINADEIKKEAKSTDISAAIEAEKIREYCLANKMDFTFETVLSTNRNIDLIKRAHDAGYIVECIFVLTISPKLNVFRIKSRTLLGGHNVPEEAVYRRYYNSLKNIRTIINLCYKFQIIDNTFSPYTIYVKTPAGSEKFFENAYWKYAAIEALVR